MTRTSFIIPAIITTLALFVSQAVHAYVAIQNKADSLELRIVPAAGPVKIDGDLKDWDLSGAIVMFLDAKSKPAYHMRAAMMFDKDYLYIGGHWKDPTPMMNQTAFGGNVGMAWNADAIQIRFVSDPKMKSDATTFTGARMPAEQQKFVNHITLWYSTQDKKAGYQAVYTLGFKDQVLNPKGVQGKFVKHEDAKGCTFEYRVPWSVLRAPRPLVGGDSVQMQFQLHWSNKQGTEIKAGLTDVRNPNSNALGYMGPGAWGTGRFMKSGNLPPATTGLIARADGHVPVKFTLGSDSKVSISIRDARGKTVRAGIGAETYPAGEHVWLWDGCDDFDQPLPAGRYTAVLLTHQGIGQKYVCNVGVSGNPPYQTEDGKGGWAGDYWAPTFVATAGDRVILGTGNAEAQKPTIGTDLEGNKLYGTTAKGLALALQGGFGYFGNNGNLTKFSLATGQLLPFANGIPQSKVPVNRGLTALDANTLVSANGEKKVFLIDIESGNPKGEVVLPVAITGGLTADGRGTLYVVSENVVGRVDLKAGTFTAVAKDLDEPKMLTCDAAGNLYVSLQGKTMQVWKLNSGGKVVQKFGKAGGRPALGKFDPAGMLKPYAIAVDKNNRLWVCEDDKSPKRYSVWNSDGKLYKEFFGSHPYSTAGYFDPKDPEKFYVYNVRYVIDYDKGTWYPDATILRTRTEEGVKLLASDYHAGGTVVVRDGRKFMLVNGEMSFKGRALYEEVGGVWVPRIAGGDWLDANNDGKVQTDERKPCLSLISAGRTVTIDNHLNLYSYAGDTWLEPTARGKRNKPFDIIRLDFLGFGPKGELRYADKVRVVAHDSEGGAFNGSCADDDGSTYALLSGGLLARGERAQSSGARIVKYGPDGKERWRYANVHPGFAWTSSSYTPGFVAAAFRMSSAQHPDLLPVTSYYGQYYLIDKQTGLFVDALGQDQRSAYTMDHTMVLTENFNGNIFKHPKTGKTYFTGGDCDCRIWELTGLDTIKRETIALSVDAGLALKSVKASEKNKRAQLAVLARNAGRKSTSLRPLAKPAVDGRDAEWQGVAALPIGDDRSKPAQVQLGYDTTNLYARFQVATTTPFRNAPTDYKLLFKSGSALELCLTPHLDNRKVGPNNRHPMQAGDLRILFARTAEGKLLATRYRPVVPSGPKPLAAFFETPAAGRENFDEISEWNDLKMHYRNVKGGYVLEVAIPWNATSIQPKTGLKFLADAGVIYGNTGGTRNATRAMWSDRTPELSVNNDIPTECRLHPNGWGVVLVEQP